MNPKTAQTIASIVVLAFTLVGGYFVRGESPFTASLTKICSSMWWRLSLRRYKQVVLALESIPHVAC